MFGGSGAHVSAIQATQSSSSNTDRVRRAGMSCDGRRPIRGVSVVLVRSTASGIHADIGRALLAEQTRGAKQHDQQEQYEEEHLSIRRRDIITGERLHDADANSACERALDA